MDRGEDVALLPLTYDFAVDIWRASNEEIYPSNLPRNGHLRAWGTTAQGVYRVGQTIEYKLFVRNESNTTLVAPPKGEYTLELVDPTGKKVDSHENIAFSAFGAYSGSYTIPEHAVMGWYRFQLKARFREGDGKNYHGEVNPRVVVLGHGDTDAKGWICEQIQARHPRIKVLQPAPGEALDL